MIEILEIARFVIHDFSFQAFQALIIPVALFSVFFYTLGFSSLIKSKKPKNIKKIFPKVTVQIPTYNEIVALRCAEKCLKFDYPKDRYEIIIGDDSSDASVSAAIDDFAKRHPVKVVRRNTNKGFKAGNLNNMTKHSKGDIIVIFDSDFNPGKNFLKDIVQPFSDKKVSCVQAKWSYLNMDQSATSKFASTILMVYHRLLARLNNMFGVALLFGSGQAVRKSVLQKLGGWQEGSVTEDVEFSVRALKNGYKTVYLSEKEIAGEVPFNMRGLRTQQKRWAYGNMRAFMDHKRDILFRKFSPMQKFLLTATMVGYTSSFFLIAFMLFGMLAFVTGEPAAIDVTFLVTDLAKNFFAASGFIFAGIVVLRQEGKLRSFPIIFISSITVGILVAFSVTKGVFKALTGQSMYWTMIKKTGNEKMSMEILPSPMGDVITQRIEGG